MPFLAQRIIVSVQGLQAPRIHLKILDTYFQNCMCLKSTSWQLDFVLGSWLPIVINYKRVS